MNKMMSNLKEAAVYVGTYRKYSNGDLAGGWLDLGDYADKEDFLDACYKLHEDEEDPELMFQDWENIPEGLISESFISDAIWLILEIDDVDMICEYLDEVYCPTDVNEINLRFIKSIQNSCVGKTTLGDYIYDNFEMLYPGCPEDLKNYIDWKKLEESYSDEFDETSNYLFSNYV